MILATILTLAPTTQSHAQEIFNVSIDAGGSLVIEDQKLAGIADYLDIDRFGNNIVIRVVDGSNSLANPTANSLITETSSTEFRVHRNNVTGSILVDMADGTDKISIGAGTAVPKNVEITSTGAIEMLRAQVDGNVKVTAGDIDVAPGPGVLTLNGGNVELITTSSTINVFSPLAANGDVLIRGSVVNVYADTWVGGTLRIVQPSDGTTALTITRTAGVLDAGTEIIIGDNTLGGAVTLGPSFSPALIADAPITLQTKGILTLLDEVRTVAPSNGLVTGVANADITFRGKEVHQYGEVQSQGNVRVLQPGDGSTPLTYIRAPSVSTDALLGIVIGDKTDAGDVTLGPALGLPFALHADVPITLQTKGTLTLLDEVRTRPVAHGPLVGFAGADLTMRGNIVNQYAHVEAEGSVKVLQPGDGATALTYIRGSGVDTDARVGIVVGDRTDAGDVTLGPAISGPYGLTADVPITLQTKGTLRLIDVVETVSPGLSPLPGVADADVTLRGNRVEQFAGVHARGILRVLQPGNGTTSLTYIRLTSVGTDSAIEIIVGENTDAGDVTLGPASGGAYALEADVPLTLQTKGTLTLSDMVGTVAPGHGFLPGVPSADLTLRGQEIIQTAPIEAEGSLYTFQPGDDATSLTLQLNGLAFTANDAIYVGDETDAGDVTVTGSDLTALVELYVRSGGSVDVSAIDLSMTGPHPIRVVGGASGLGSMNFLGGVSAGTPALGTFVDGGAGDDSFTFGGDGQSLDDTGDPLTVDGKGGDDTIVLDDTQDNTKNEYTLKTGEVDRNVGDPTIDYISVERVEILGGVKDDELILDFSLGNPFAALTSGISFDGGDQNTATGDAITLQGGTVSPITHNFTDANSGSIDFPGGSLSYTGLEPIFDNLDVADRFFLFSGGDETVHLKDDANTFDGISEINSTLGETVFFTNPTGTLEVNTGGGDDVFIMRKLDGSFDMNVPILVKTDGGDDTFDVKLATSFTASVELRGGDDNDHFEIRPRVGLTTVRGGDPTTYPGDVLDLDLSAGATIESFISGAVDNRDGTWTFAGALDDIDFFNIEEQLDYSDVKVKIVVNDDKPTVGATVIYTVTAKNLLPGRSTGLKLNVPVSTMGQRFLKAEADFGEYDPATGIWTIGELKDSEKATLEIHSQIRVFRQLTMFAEVFEVDQFDPNSTPNNMALGENDYDQVLVSPNPIETPGPNDFFRPTSIEGTSFATLAVSPHDPTAKSGSSTNYLFAGSTDGGLHRSTDGGANWPRVGLKDKIIRAMSVSSLTGAIYVGDYGEGMYRSVDDGLTFVDVNSGIPVGTSRRVIASAIDEFAPRSGADGDVYIGTDGGGIFLSEDDGATWTAINTGLGMKIVRALLVVEDGSGGNKEQIYAGTLGGGVYTLKEGETTWTAANGTGAVMLGDKYVYALVESPIEGAIYAGTGDGIYKTLDKGATWTLVKADTPTRAFATYVNSGTEYIFAGTDGAFVQVSTDGGATWFEQNIGLDDRTVEVVLVTEDGILFAGTATQGIFRSDDLGVNWYRVTSFMQNAVIQAMTFDDAGELYVGTYGFGVFHTDDAMNFTRVNTGLDNHWVFALAHTPGDALFAGTWNKGVYRSVDDARTWQFVGLPYRNVYDFAIRDAYTIYAATDRGEVARSVDNGLTWHEVGVATTAIYALAIDPTNPNVVYAGTFGAGTYKSTDGAHSFTKTGMPDTHVFDFAFDPLTGDLWAATSTGPMFSADGGTTWTTLVGGLDNVDTRAIVFNDIAVPLIGTWGGGVSRYDDIADEWIEYGMTDMPILAFAISPVDGDLYAGTDGMGVFRRSFGVITGREKEEPLAAELPTDYALDQNYPNPFNPVTTISFDLPESGYARLAVYDVVGREVRVVVDGSLNAGKHEVRMDAADLPSGIYVYRLDANGQSFAKKMVLMK